MATVETVLPLGSCYKNHVIVCETFYLNLIFEVWLNQCLWKYIM